MKRCLIARLLSAALIVSAMASTAAGQSPASVPSNSASVGVPQGTALVAELAKSIDARKAKAGEAVKARIVQDVLANGRILIHRGSKVLGHITTARAFGQNEPKSVLGIVFDQLNQKGGQQVSFHGVLVALAPPIEQNDVLADSSSNYGGGGSVDPSHVSHGSYRPIVDPRDHIDHTREDALRNAADPNSYGKDNTLHNGYLGAGNRGVFGIKGLSLKAVSDSASTQLVSSKDDIKLESGTQLVLGVTASR